MALPAPSVATAGIRIVPQVAGFQARLTSALTGPLAVASLAATGALVGLGAAFGITAFKATTEFAKVELSMAKIVGLVGVAREQVDQWQSQLGDVARETGQGPEQLAEALFFVTSAGIRGAEAMDVLEQSARAATAGLGNTKDIADAVTSAMNAYGKENLSAAQATDILVATVREGKVQADAVAGSLGRVIPLASQLGIEFHEVGASLAAMTRLGLSAEESATALRGIMTALIRPARSSQKELAKFGLSAQDLRNELSGEGDLLSLLLKLRNTFGDNEEAMGRVFPRIRGLTGVLNLVGENAEEARAIFDTLADSTGDLDKAFDAVASTGGFAFTQALADIQATLVEVGEEFLPILSDALRELIPIMKQQLIPLLISGAQQAVNFAVGLGQVVQFASHLPGGLKAIAVGIGLVATALLALGGHPIVAGLTVVVGLVALIGNNARKQAAQVNDLVEILEGGGSALAWIKGRASEMEGFTELIDHFAGNWAEVVRAITGTEDEWEAFADGLGVLADNGEISIGTYNTWIGVVGELRGELEEANILIDEEAAALELARVNAISHKDALDENLRAANDLDPALASLGVTTETLGGTFDSVVRSAEDWAEILAEAKKRTEDLAEAEARLADPAFDLIKSIQDRADAVAKVAETRKDKDSTPEDVLAAVLKVLEAEAKVEAATGRFVANQSTALDKFDEIVARLPNSMQGALEELRQVVLRASVPSTVPLGRELASGVVVGLGGLSGQLERELIAQIQRGLARARIKAGILSPSTLFRDELGLPLAQGVAAGIEMGGREVRRAMDNLVQLPDLATSASGGGGNTYNYSAVVNNPIGEEPAASIQKGLARVRTVSLINKVQ